jgi:hypothetical protein
VLAWEPVTAGIKLAGDDAEQTAKREQAAAILLRKFNIYFCCRHNRAYWVMADNGSMLLQSLVEKDAASGLRLADSVTAKEIWKAIPDDAHFVSQLSINRLLKLVSKFSDGKIVYRSIPDAPGWIGYVRYDKDMIRQGVAWSAGELAEFVAQLGQQVLESLGKKNTERI